MLKLKQNSQSFLVGDDVDRWDFPLFTERRDYLERIRGEQEEQGNQY